VIDQEHLEHIQANLRRHSSILKRSGSDDSVPGGEISVSDPKYRVTSANEEETESFLPLESDVVLASSIPEHDVGALDEVQPGTSGTDNTGQVGIVCFSL
jgi:hypothetical protein